MKIADAFIFYRRKYFRELSKAIDDFFVRPSPERGHRAKVKKDIHTKNDHINFFDLTYISDDLDSN